MRLRRPFCASSSVIVGGVILEGRRGERGKGGERPISMVVQLQDQYIQCTITFLRCVCGNVVSGGIVRPLYNFPVTFDPWGTLASVVEGREYC